MTSARSPRRARPTDADHIIASVVLLLLSAITAIAMCRVFADWVFLRSLLVMVVGVHAVSIVLRIARVPGIVAMPIVLLVVIELLALLFYRDTLHVVLPSGDTLRFMRLDLRLVWSQFPSAVAPVPSEGGFLIAAALGIGLVAMFADAFAFRAYGRAEAVVPAGVLFVFTAALGTERNRITVASAWFAAALVVVAVLRALHGGGTESWLGRRRRAVGAALPATAMCALVAALGAGVLGPLVPGAGSEPLLDTRQSDSDVTSVLNPLVDIRSQLVNRRNTEMFTVSASAGRYWRASGLTQFDGTTWSLPDSSLQSADGELNATFPQSQIVQQQIKIGKLGGELVPTAFRPIRTAQTDLLWLPSTDTLVLDEGSLEAGDVYNIAADVYVPPAEVLRAAGVAAPPGPEFLELPSGVPSEVVDQAFAVTADATTPYDKAIALQNWFRTEFTYDLNVQSGHSDNAILSFLRIRRGYCEQFAGTFGVMARAIGLPARVAVGFTKGELGSDGVYHVYGRNAHAWPEVWFDGIGWVLFEPTPGRGAPGAESATGVPEAQDDSPTEFSDEPAATVTPTTLAPGTPTTIRPLEGNPEPRTGTSVPVAVVSGRASGGSNGAVPWILLAIAVVVAWAVAMPALVRRFTRTGATPSERVITAWHGAVGALQLAGAPPPGGATPVEYAVEVERELGVDHRSILELARFVTRAIYSPDGVGEPAALRAAVLRTHLDDSSRERMPWYTRILTRVDPRLVRQRLVGERVRGPRSQSSRAEAQ